MIIITLKDYVRYEHRFPILRPLFDYIKTYEIKKHVLRRVKLNGDNLFINNVNLDAVVKVQ